MNNGNFDPLGLGGGFIQAGMMPMQRAQPATKQPQKKKEKDFWIDQISTAGGIIGGIGGGALGALAGGFGAIPGAAVGGGAGSALGETLENILTGEDDISKNVLNEGVTGAVFGGGPLRLAKTALGARTALNTAKNTGQNMGLKDAIRQGSDEAAQWTLRGAAGGMLANKSIQLATKQFGLTDSFIANYSKKYGEDAGKTLNRYGINTAEEAEKAIAKQQDMFNTLVQSAGNIPKTTIQTKLNKIGQDLLTQAPSAQQAVGQKLLAEMDQLIGQFDDKVPATVLNGARQQYDKLVNYTRQQADPATYDVNKRVADVLRETIQEATGNKQLKETGMELSRLRTLSDEIAKRAPQVESRASSPLGFRNLLGAAVGGSAGGVAGGPLGAIAGAGLVSAVNSPAGRRVATNLATGGAEQLVKSGKKAAPFQMSPLGTAGRVAGLTALTGGAASLPGQASATPQDASLEGMLMDQSMSSGSQNSMATPAMMDNTMTNMSDPMGMGIQYQSTPTGASPYSKENLLMDINRDPQNAKQYIAYYQQLDEIFNPQVSGGGNLSSNTASSLAMSDNGLNTIRQLEEAYAATGGGSGKVGGGIQQFLADKTDWNPAGGVYKGAAGSAETQLAKAINGGGQVSDADAAAIRQFIPQITDTPEEARQKFAYLRQRLMAARQNMMMYNTSAGSNSLEDTLMTQGGYY